MSAATENWLPTLVGLIRAEAGSVELAAAATRLAANRDQAYTLLGLSTLYQYGGQVAQGLALQAQALALRQHYWQPAPTAATGRKPIRLLALQAAGEYLVANTPLEFLLEQADVEVHSLFLTATHPWPAELPPHDVLWVSFGVFDSDLALLQSLLEKLAQHPHPVLNRPECILRLARDRAFTLLHGASGIVMPPTARLSRAALEGAAAECPASDFPLIVRPVDAHAGRGLARISQPSDFDAYLRQQPEAEFYLSHYVDYASRDGQFRKYRIALIDGVPYLCHLAIASDWVVHYETAGMADSLDKRAEEALAMLDFDDDFARRHAAAFATIGRQIGLDYLVIDCAETRDGQLLIFELDNRGFVHDIDSSQIYPYKPWQMCKVFAAFQVMLEMALLRHYGAPLRAAALSTGRACADDAAGNAGGD